jgi:hypothetical protein
MILVLYRVRQTHTNDYKGLSYVKPDAPDCADLAIGQRRKKTAYNRRIFSLLPRVQDGTTGKDMYLHLMVLAERDAHVNIVLLRLTNEDFGRVCGRNKTHQAY